MRTKTMIIGLLTIGVFLISFESAIGAGGPFPSDHCAAAVDAAVVTDISPLIHGTFTAAHFIDINNAAGGEEDTIRININLERPKILTSVVNPPKYPRGTEVVIRKLFSKKRPAINTKHLCVLKDKELIELYKFSPCMWELGHAFGIAGTPVITDLEITGRGPSCAGGNGMGWISGTVKIRVVPDHVE